MANQMLYGFIQLKDLANDRVQSVGVQVIDNAINATLEEYNRQINAFTGLFVMPTTEYSARFKTSSVGRLQPLDENGRARPIKAFGHYDVAFPIKSAGTAWGATYIASMKMTVQEINNAMATMMLADTAWMRDQILGALFADASWSFIDDEKGALTIKGLANNDTDKYLPLSGAGGTSTANHYLAQAADISDAANPFPAIYDALMDRPENGGEVIVFVPSNLTDDIEALANFKERSDPNIREGANTAVLVGSLQAQVPGTVIGYVDKCWIVEWRSLPDGYMIGVTTEGDKPLAMRQDPEPELQGFKKVAERNDHPFYENQYLRRAGFGAWNRVGALVYRVGNGSYAVPTGYGQPML